MAEERTGLSVFDGVLVVGGVVVAVIVAFWVLSFIAGLVWTVVKLALVVAVVLFLARLVFGRHR